MKPIITFCEPFEILAISVKGNKETMSYLKETNITENQMLEKYDIDYDSFFRSNIRDEKGSPENIKSKNDIHVFLLDYINTSE